MAATESASRLGPYVERLLQNGYVQDNLLDAVENLRRAYERSQKRRVEPARDKKIRRQLREAAFSLNEAGQALKSGRQEPKKRRAKRMLFIMGLGAVGVAGAWRSSERSSEASSSAVIRSPEGATAFQLPLPRRDNALAGTLESSCWWSRSPVERSSTRSSSRLGLSP